MHVSIRYALTFLSRALRLIWTYKLLGAMTTTDTSQLPLLPLQLRHLSAIDLRGRAKKEKTYQTCEAVVSRIAAYSAQSRRFAASISARLTITAAVTQCVV